MRIITIKIKDERAMKIRGRGAIEKGSTSVHIHSNTQRTMQTGFGNRRCEEAGPNMCNQKVVSCVVKVVWILLPLWCP